MEYAGNLLKDDKATYTYNDFNQITKVETFDGNVQINRYDVEGLRYEMEENGQLVQFIFNTEREVVAEKENEWTIYIRGSELLASSNDHARTYYHYASDEMGSITHIVDDKEILNEYEYDAWGNVVSQKETVKNRFKFNGQQLDPITQQYYLRARFYNPVIARFTQEDTYRGDGLNLYAYCQNNPTYYVDPTGHLCQKALDICKEARENNKTAIEAYKEIADRNVLKSVEDNSKEIVYRALNSKDYDRITQKLSLEAKNPNGKWGLKEHLISGSSKSSWINDPFISTTSNLEVAKGFNESGSNLGIIAIDLSKVKTDIYKGYEHFPRVNGEDGLPYHYSIWQQEVTIYQSIPYEAIIDFFM